MWVRDLVQDGERLRETPNASPRRAVRRTVREVRRARHSHARLILCFGDGVKEVPAHVSFSLFWFISHLFVL